MGGKTVSLLFALLFLLVPPSDGGCPVFPANNIWNTPVDHLPVHPLSATYVANIGSSASLHPDFGSGLWEGGPIGIPFVTAAGSQTKYPATFLYAGESDPGPYAVPLNAPIEGGSSSTGDRHALAVDEDNCILYELYRAFPQSSSWKADSGAIFNLLSHALRTPTWTSADAAGLPIFAGLVRYDEVVAGEIRHAIRFTAPRTQRAFVWPARHYASSLTDPKYPPMGQRFRLKADYDIRSFPPEAQVILRALKKYGMMLADNGSAWYISGAPDERWNNDVLRELRRVAGSSFEAVDATALMVEPNSGEALQNGVSVAITPGSAVVTIGQFRQFAAVVNGAGDQSVTWAVNGETGGSATFGFISTAGLYSAPGSIPSPSTFPVTATSVAVPAASASSSLILLPPPHITAATPNPLFTGSFTMKVTGSGFRNGDVVWLSGSPLSSTFVSASQLSARGQAASPASGLPVVVKRGDGAASNTVAVSIVPAPVKVSVSPAAATIRTGNGRKFTATVTGTSNTRVTWKVNGITGGNSLLGRINVNGWYTAPASPVRVVVSAVSAAAPSSVGNATVSVVRR